MKSLYYKARILLSSKILLDNISVFEIDEIGVKTLQRELKSCLTCLTSCLFICRLLDLFQFYLNQWKHIHDLFKFQLYINCLNLLLSGIQYIWYPINYYLLKSNIWYIPTRNTTFLFGDFGDIMTQS